MPSAHHDHQVAASPVPGTITARQAVQTVSDLLQERGRDWYDIVEGTPLNDLGLDSMEMAELFMAFEEVAGQRLDPESADGIRLVGDLARLRPL
jgi:acyl carrier protein